MEPVHIFHIFVLICKYSFHLNQIPLYTLIACAADVSSFLLDFIEEVLSTPCRLSIFSIMFFKLLLSVSIILCQIDRFLTLYLNAKYKNYIHDDVALNACILR